jgi:hypothetical protein
MSWLSAALGKATGGIIGDAQPIPAPSFVPTLQATAQQGLQNTLNAAAAAAANAASEAAHQGTSWLDHIVNGLPGNNQPIGANQIGPSLATPLGLLAAGVLVYFIAKDG